MKLKSAVYSADHHTTGTFWVSYSTRIRGSCCELKKLKMDFKKIKNFYTNFNIDTTKFKTFILIALN